MTETPISKNGIPIRLTDERWVHITEEHSELAELRTEVLKAIEDPVQVVAGGHGRIAGGAPVGVGETYCSRVS